MVNKENVKLWIDELRSGKYMQGNNRLTTVSSNEHRHCCLGVACVTYNKYSGDNLISIKIDEDDQYVMYNNVSEYLPSIVSRWLNLPSANPLSTISKEGFKRSYSDLNDMFDFTFEQIANELEKQYIHGVE